MAPLAIGMPLIPTGWVTEGIFMSRSMASQRKEDLSPTERSKVVHPLKKDTVLQSLSDGSRVVLDLPSEFFRGQIRVLGHRALLYDEAIK
jgi:hypothetical protein